MPIPLFITELRGRVGHDLLWLTTATAVVFDDDGRVLIGRRSDNGRWALPGGIIEPGEEPADAVVREVLEETGVIAVPERLVAVTVEPPVTLGNGDKVQYLDLLFRCLATGGEATVNDSESVEVRWSAPDALPDLSDQTLGLLEQAKAAEAPAVFGFSGRACGKDGASRSRR